MLCNVILLFMGDYIMDEYTDISAKELSELQRKHRQELKEKRAEIDYIKRMSQRIKARGAIVTALMTDSEKISDEEFYKKMKEILRVSGDKRLDGFAE
jgi:coenzyme F420-reducing hydrogenase alpha subunit